MKINNLDRRWFASRMVTSAGALEENSLRSLEEISLSEMEGSPSGWNKNRMGADAVKKLKVIGWK